MGLTETHIAKKLWEDQQAGADNPLGMRQLISGAALAARVRLLCPGQVGRQGQLGCSAKRLELRTVRSAASAPRGVLLSPSTHQAAS